MTALLLTLAMAGCQQPVAVVKQYQQQHVAAYVAPQQVLYFVGAPLRVESLVEHAKRTDQDWQEFKEFKAWKAGAATAQQRQAMQTETLPPPAPQSAVAKHCGACHGTATPKGGVFIDGQPGMRPETITAALRSIVSGEMPKGKQLTREEKNLLLGELLSLEVPSQEQEE